MKRTIAILTALFCLLAAVSALAETAQAVAFDAFTVVPSPRGYLMPADPSTGMIFQYFPRHDDGDTSTNLLCMVMSPLPLDPMTMSDTDRNDFVDGLVQGMTNQMTAVGATLNETNVVWDDPVYADGVPGICFSVTIDMSYFGQQILVYETGILFRVNGDGYIFMSGAQDPDTAAAVMAELIDTLTWNK